MNRHAYLIMAHSHFDFLKELHLVEGRNTGIPTALKAIQNNGSPLPEFITDDERSFFSVIVPIHDSFLSERKEDMNRPIKKRRTKKEIKKLIVEMLDDGDYSAGMLYRMLGYSGNISKTFKSCIDDLLAESTIRYLETNINSPHNVLTKK